MAEVMPWGGEYSLIAELGLPVNYFTLDSPTLGVLDGNCYLNGRAHDDLTDRLLEVSLSRGRHDQFQDFQAGTMNVLLSNNDRELDPVNQSSRYWDPVTGTSGVTVRRRVILYYENTPIFTGRITDVDIQYQPTTTITRSTVSLDISDDFLTLANIQLNAFTPSNELSGSRVNTILARTEVAYPGTTSIAAGTITCLNDPIDAGTRVLDALQQVVATERGYMFMTGAGSLLYTNRITGSPTSWKLFADDATGTKYNSLSIIYGQENLFNRVIAKPIGSTNPGLANNTPSQTTFGISSLSLSDLLCSDADAQIMADYLLSLYGTPSYRFDSMTVQFAGDSISAVDQQEIMDLDLGDTVRIYKTFSVGSPSQIYQNVTIEHIDQTITPLSHQITYKFSPASFTTFTRTANGTAGTAGIGVGVAYGLHIAPRTATGAGGATAGSVSVGLHISPRTGTGSGVGSSIIVTLHISPRTATGSGSATTADVAIGVHIAPRAGTGSGTGTGTAVRIVVAIRTATGSGVGAGTAIGLHTSPRGAVGAGGATTSDTAVGFVTRVRTATGSGIGSGTAVGSQKIIKTATGSGTGGSSATGIRIAYLILDSAVDGILNTNVLASFTTMPRTATGAGAATSGDTAVGLRTVIRTGTNAGTSSSATVATKVAWLVLDSATIGIIGTNTLASYGVYPRTATGSGLGTDVAVKLNNTSRTAIGSGTGTGTAIKVIYTAPSSVDYLVVAGGGGASGGAGGGGGAGGMKQASSFAVSGTLTVTVGGGGTGGGSYPAGGYSASGAGNNSVFSSITSTGGGSSGGQNDVATSGGSGGGGGGGTNQPSQQTAGTGTSGQGNNGAAGIWNNRGGGGGGAGAAGSGLTGGAGAAGTITGTTYAGGGGAGGYTTWGYGGSGGGGTGTAYSDPPTSGGTNLGGGGGGGGESNPGSTFATAGGGAGGSGIVIIRYSNSYKDLTSISAGLTYTKTTPSGYIVYTFTAGTGTITI